MKLSLIAAVIFFTGIRISFSQTILLTNSGVLPGDSNTRALSSSGAHYVKKVNVFTRLSFEGGYIMPVDDKSSVNDLLKNSSYTSWSISNTWDVSPSSVYSSIYRKPKLGVGLAFMNFHNESLGKPYVFYGYTEIPINKRDNRLNFTYGIGVGVAWNFNHYDKTSNPENEVIGSSVNAHIQASINMYYWLSNNFEVGLGTGFRHYSNGALQKPNAGINIIPLNLSLQYKIRERQTTDYVAELPKFRRRWGYSIYNSVGAKQLVKEEPVVFKDVLGFNAGYSLSYKYRAVVGFEFTYTAGSAGRVDGDASQFSKSVSYGPYIGWEWFLTDRIYIPIYLGAYIHRNIANEEEGLLFQRLGFRYCFLPSRALVAGIGLKSHLGSADFMEFTLGMNF